MDLTKVYDLKNRKL